MADLIFVSVLVTFFALCVAYLKWCDRIIGPDEFGAELDDATSPYIVTGPATADASTTTTSGTERVTA
jgi:hypothetical protein